FADRCETLFRSSGLMPKEQELDKVFVPAEPFHDVPWNTEEGDLRSVLQEDLDRGPPLVILEDERFKHYSPQVRADLLSPRIYLSTFASFLERIDETLSAAGQNGEAN